MRKAFIPFDNKHPVVLPHNSNLARLVALYHHRIIKHQGRTLSLGAVRSAGYYIVGGRSLINSLISRCTICQRLRGKPVVPRMADLPADRLEECPVFTYTGLDMFGPFNITEGITTKRILLARRYGA